MCSTRAVFVALALLLVVVPSKTYAQAAQAREGLVMKEDGTQIPLSSVNTVASKATQQALADAALLSPTVVTSILRRLEAMLAATGDDTSSLKGATLHSSLLVPYLRQFGGDELLQAMRSFAKNKDSLTAAAQLLAAAGKFDAAGFVQWAQQDITGKGEPSSAARAVPASPKKKTSPAKRPRSPPKKKAPPAPKSPDMNDPLTQLVDWSKRMKSLGGRLDFLLKDVTAKSPKPNNPYLNVGDKKFKPRRIGLVFHAMLFKDAQGFLYPPQAYWQGVRAAQRMVKKVNELFLYSGTNIQFFLKAFRSDVKKYPYLSYKSLEDYQKCATLEEKCTCHLAIKHSLQPNKYINIFLVGSSSYRGFAATASAYSTSIPGYLDACGFLADPLPTSRKAAASSEAGAAAGDYHDDYYDLLGTTDYAYNAKETPRYQHIWASWDAMDLLVQNSAQQANKGPANMAHELGHMLGLLHVFGDSCTDSGDRVADTPTEEYFGSILNVMDVQPLCKQAARGILPKAADLKEFDSCPKQKGTDNVFNIMSYAPPECRFLFTKGQVLRMQAHTLKYNPNFGQP